MLDNSEEAVDPITFITCLRLTFPQFATKLKNSDSQMEMLEGMLGGGYAQQDANECWVVLMRILQRAFVDPAVSHKIPVSYYACLRYI